MGPALGGPGRAVGQRVVGIAEAGTGFVVGEETEEPGGEEHREQERHDGGMRRGGRGQGRVKCRQKYFQNLVNTQMHREETEVESDLTICKGWEKRGREVSSFCTVYG